MRKRCPACLGAGEFQEDFYPDPESLTAAQAKRYLAMGPATRVWICDCCDGEGTVSGSQFNRIMTEMESPS